MPSDGEASSSRVFSALKRQEHPHNMPNRLNIMPIKRFKKLLFNRWSAFLHDMLWVPFSLAGAYLLRFNLEPIPKNHLDSLWLLVLISIPIHAIAFNISGMYRGMWRFASIPDLFRILKAVSIGALCVTACIFLATRLTGVPRSVIILYPLLLLCGLCLPRLIYRWFKDQKLTLHKKEEKRVIIIGAGKAGELLLRDLRHQGGIHTVGFLDDDQEKENREIHRVPILGSVNRLADITTAYDIQEIFIAIPSATKEQVQRIFSLCSDTGLQVSTLPSLREMKGHTVSTTHLRPLSIEDLLGRDTVQLDKSAIRAYLDDKTILVTGGGGSIGSELCRQIGTMTPAKLVIFDHAEYNLYAIEQELRQKFPDMALIIVLGDVKNEARVDWAFKKFRPDVVFHAAAYKHVPMLELNPAEAVSNNIIGTKIVADKAYQYDVKRFVQVSTDKAVNPTNVMGTTKRIGELYCQNLNNRSRTRYITTRFGNVLGSAGSVVPLFQKQIAEGGPVTVTHPDITRYFMTIPEAVNLILQAGSMGDGGEIYVLNMGEPVKILDLAEQMINLSGYRVGDDIEIVFTGLRPGEKLYEELLHTSEGLKPTSHRKLLLAKSREVDWSWLISELESLKQAAISRNIMELKLGLKNIVPEYQID